MSTSQTSAPGCGVFDIRDQSIIVTGGGDGLGRVMALGLAAAGANLTLAGRTESKLKDTVEQITVSGSKAVYCLLDATDRKSCDTWWWMAGIVHCQEY